MIYDLRFANGWKRISLVVFILLGAVRVMHAAVPATPDFKEVYDLLKTNLAGADDAQLNRAAVLGLIAKLEPRVKLVSADGTTGPGTNQPLLARAVVLDGAFAYLRVRGFAAGVDVQFREAYQRLVVSNKLKGVVVDLRFAGGTDYAAAAALAEAFIPGEKPLLDWGAGMKSSSGNGSPITLPLTLLLNRQTSGAAEALAAMLRQASVGVLIGATTAGQASMFQEFPLTGGQRLRVATTPIKLGNGEAMSLAGLVPDISVEVDPGEEKFYFEDAYRSLKTNQVASVAAVTSSATNLAGTNRVPRRRLNEAELVRMQREGQLPDLEPSATGTGTGRDREPVPQLINDPALARAVDLLKGLAVVQRVGRRTL